MGHKKALSMLLPTLATLFLLVSCIPLDEKDKKLNSKEEKRQSSCIPKCANPRGFTGCGTCEHSKCMLKGCVHYGAFGPRWKPDNCTTCHCSNNEKRCFQETCEPAPNCFGYPTMKVPGKCCEECDFEAARNECKLIPKALNASLVSSVNTSCRQVLQHGCNREFVVSGGKWYKCVPKEGQSELSKNTGCEGIEGQYWDYTRCNQVEISPRNLPEDYDDDPTSCSIFIH